MSTTLVVRTTCALVALVGLVAVGVTVAVLAMDDSEPDSAVQRAFDRAFDSDVEGARTPGDAAFMDDYAEELTIVMGRARHSFGGTDAEAFARRVDGPEPGVEILQATGSLRDGDGATVVLRLRRERTESKFLGEGDTYEVSACYRWVFGGPDWQRGPQRLDECPDPPVTALGSPPVEPELPHDLSERLERDLEPLVEREVITEVAVLEKVRSIYAEAAREARERPGAGPESILSEDEAVAGDGRMATADDGAVGVAVGKRGECVLVRLAPGDPVSAWVPPRISQLPGEFGCSASWASRGGEM